MDNFELHVSWSLFEPVDHTFQPLIAWLLDNRCNDRTSPHYGKQVVVHALVDADTRAFALMLEDRVTSATSQCPQNLSVRVRTLPDMADSESDQEA